MTPPLEAADIAQRLRALDWSGVPVEHQLAASAAAAHLASDAEFQAELDRYKPADNVVTLPVRRKSRWTSIVSLDGHAWLASTHFGPSGAWGWIVESVAAELGCDEDAVGSLESDDGDLVTVDGLPVYRIRTEWR